ncbi:TPA: hypothetical protein ACGUU3_004218 [Vibrio vulnificus]
MNFSKHALLLVFFSGTCFSAPWRHTFHVSTDIDINRFYNHNITSVLLEHPSMTAVFNKKTSTFNALNTRLTVETNIPMSNNGYTHNIRMMEKQNQCFDSGNNQILTSNEQESFNQLLVSGTPVPLNKDINLGGFSDSKNSFKAQSHEISVTFSPLDPSVVRYCHGSLKLTVSLDL